MSRSEFVQFSMISYAQNYEDVMLRRVFGDQQDGFYLDVGAMDPVIDSVTKYFYDRGWSGINIEPNEQFYSKLVQERPRDINLNLALGDREESRTMHVFEEYGNSTFEEASRDRFVRRGFEPVERQVRVTTLAAVCGDHVRRPIDFMKVDCEGWEEFVLKGADWDRFRPTALLVEATEPETPTPSWSAWEPFLIEKARYDMVYFDGLNRYFVPRERSELRRCFEAPPNVFDGFRSYAHERAEQTGQALQVERESLTAQLAETEENLVIARAETEAAQMHCKKLLTNAAAQAKQEVQQVRRELKAQLAEVEVQAGRYQDRIRELEEERREAELRKAQVDEALAKTRLWVGKLSQDVAAAKRR